MVIAVRSKSPVDDDDDAPTLQVPASKPTVVPLKKAGFIARRPTVEDKIKKSEFVVKGELAEVVNQIKSVYGANVITRTKAERVHYGRVKSGILSLDLCLGGGLMRSRAAMIYGNRSAGKSTLALRIVAALQREYPDDVAGYLDIEGTYDAAWAAVHGVDNDRLLKVEPETGEAAIDIADALMRADGVSAVVTDSIAFLTPMKEIQGSAEDSLPGIHARLIGNYVRRVNNAMLQERHRGHLPLVLHLNQWRMSIGVMFGDPRVLPGGRALEFSTSQQIEAYNKEHTAGGAEAKEAKKNAKDTGGKAEKSEAGSLVVFNEHSFKITKDKTGGRLKEGKFKLIRDESMGLPVGYIDQSKTIISTGLQSGVLSGVPQSFSHDGFGKWKGQPDFLKFLVEHPDTEREICSQITDAYKKKWGVEG